MIDHTRHTLLQIAIRGTVPPEDQGLVDPDMLQNHVVHMVINISRLRSVVRYTTSVYGELAQNLYTVMDMEGVLEIRHQDKGKTDFG